MFDVYGDRNCLFYSLLLLLRVHDKQLSLISNIHTATLISKLRKALLEFFKERYYRDGDTADPILSKMKLEILVLWEDEETQNTLKQLGNYSDKDIYASHSCPAEVADLNEFLAEMYQERVKYVDGNSENNFWKFNNIMAKGSKDKKGSENNKKRKDNQEVLPTVYVPDGHLVARLFVRMFKIPLVLVKIQVECHKKVDEFDNLTRADKGAKFSFFIYEHHLIEPKIEHHKDNFPTHLLEKYSYYILAQSSMEFVDKEETKLDYVYLDKERTESAQHHKFLVTNYIAPPVPKPKEQVTVMSEDTSSKEEEEERVVEKCDSHLHPGDIIQYYTPGQNLLDFWRVYAVVLSIDPDRDFSPITTTDYTSIPPEHPIKRVGVMKDTSKADESQKKEFDEKGYYLLKDTKPYELERYQMEKEEPSEDVKKKADALKLNKYDPDYIDLAFKKIEEKEMEIWRRISCQHFTQIGDGTTEEKKPSATATVRVSAPTASGSSKFPLVVDNIPVAESSGGKQGEDTTRTKSGEKTINQPKSTKRKSSSRSPIPLDEFPIQRKMLVDGSGNSGSQSIDSISSPKKKAKKSSMGGRDPPDKNNDETQLSKSAVTEHERKEVPRRQSDPMIQSRRRLSARQFTLVEQSYILHGLAPPSLDFPSERFVNDGVMNNTVSNSGFKWRGWIDTRKAPTWQGFKTFTMSNIELCRLLVSPLQATTYERFKLSEKIRREYESMKKAMKVPKRPDDFQPGLDNYNYWCLREVYYNKMKFKFDFCRHKDRNFDPTILMSSNQGSDVLCYLLKVHLNVDIVKKGYEGTYGGGSPDDIGNEIQRVRNIIPNDVNIAAESKKYKDVMRHVSFGHMGDQIGPFFTWIVVVPGRYFYTRYAKYGNGDTKDYVKLPVKWLERHVHHRDRSMQEDGFVTEYITEHVYTYKKNCNAYSNSILDSSLVGNTTGVDSFYNYIGDSLQDKIKSENEFPISSSWCSLLKVVKGNPALWYRCCDLVHRDKTLTIESISDFKPAITGRKLHFDGEKGNLDTVLVKDEGLVPCEENVKVEMNLSSVDIIGKRRFWGCRHLSGPISSWMSNNAMKVDDVSDYIILQCDSMSGMPYLCKGCCFMLFDGFDWECGVVVKLNEECLEYKKFKALSLTVLESIVVRVEWPQFTKNHVFMFVNVFHRDQIYLENNFLHHCVVNKYGNVEGMLKPTVWKLEARETELFSKKFLRWRKRRKAKHNLLDDSIGDKEPTRSKLPKSILEKKEECWHTIYVNSDNRNACNEVCKKNKEEESFYIVVPSPMFDVKKESWVVFPSGFRYCYRECFIVDVRYFMVMKSIDHVIPLHCFLSKICVGKVNLIQPDDCNKTRFCLVSGCQFKSLRRKEGVELLRTKDNLYLYEYTNKASWSLPGCVVSSWECDEELPEFTMQEVHKLSRAVKKGTRRRRTKNKGTYLTLGPRLSRRPKPNPVIQDEHKLFFSDFHRQNWKSQEVMYLLCKKLCHAGECIRQMSVTLNPGYMRLVGHYCCARQLLTSGVCKPKVDYSGKRSQAVRKEGRTSCNSEYNTIGYVNSLHDDTCDLIQQNLVSSFIEKFIGEVRSTKKMSASTKSKLIKKVKEIQALVGLGFPTTCAHNIICHDILDKKASVSSLFIMFDFAMTLSHKIVHNFFGWAFTHCTALPMMIFYNGSVQLSNDDADDKDCVVVFAWGINGGSKESGLNTNMKSLDQNCEEKEERDKISNSVVDRISIM